MVRPGHFRHRLLDEAFLAQYSAQAFHSLMPFVALWENNKIQDVEMAAIYLWIFSYFRRPQDFLGGPHQEKIEFSDDSHLLSGKEAVEILLTTLTEDPSNPLYKLRQSKTLKRLHQNTSLLKLICSNSLRSIPFSAIRSLYEWHRKEYPLKLMTTIPTADEVLLMQTYGWRCVSMLLKEQEISHFVLEGRDVLGFLVHDLIHADHFFIDRNNAKAQIYFSQKLLEIRHNPLVLNMMSDSQFVDEFHYLMSDMNSVPLHLFKALKTVILGFYKRRDKLPMTSMLDSETEAEFQLAFSSLIKPWNFSTEGLRAALCLNTPTYKHPEDSLILDQQLRPTEKL